MTSEREPSPGPRERERIEAGLARYDALSETIDQYRSTLLLHVAAKRIAHSHPSAAEFTLAPHPDDADRWQLLRLRAADRRVIDPGMELTAEVAQVLASHRFVPASVWLTEAIRQQGEGPSWTVQMAPILAHGWQAPARIIDTVTLTEREFDQAYVAARARLDLIGMVRTRRDFLAQFRESPRLRDNLSEETIAIATEAALVRYREAVERPGGVDDAEAELFHQVVGEVARFLNLEAPDDHTPGQSSPAMQPDTARPPQL